MSEQVSDSLVRDDPDVVTSSPDEHGSRHESPDYDSDLGADQTTRVTGLAHLLGNLLEEESAPIVALVLALI